MVRQGRVESERVPLLCLAGPLPVHTAMDYRLRFRKSCPGVRLTNPAVEFCIQYACRAVVDINNVIQQVVEVY